MTAGRGPMDVVGVDNQIEFRDRANGELLWTMTSSAACNLVKSLVDAFQEAGRLADPHNPLHGRKVHRLRTLRAEPGSWRPADGTDPDGSLHMTVDAWWPPDDDGWTPVQGWRKTSDDPNDRPWVSVLVSPQVWDGDIVGAVSPAVAAG